jgi:hypothetical protein
MLIPLLKGIYDVCALHGVRWNDVQSFSKTGSSRVVLFAKYN